MALPDTTETLSVADGADARAVRAADRTRIADIEVQILESERSISSLKEERNLLQDRLATYAYPVLTLPNEIVSEIFVHFLPVYPGRPPPIGHLSSYLPCQICRKWREIAFATPKLWRAISLSLNKVERFPQKLRYLKASLGLSGSCLLSIKLESHIMDSSYLCQLGQTIADHCSRWEYLEMNVHLYDFPGLNHSNFLPDIELPMPFLRGLKLGGGMERLTATPLEAPALEKVALRVYHYSYTPVIPWAQLTVISVDDIQFHQYSFLITELVNVVHCRFNISPAGEPSLRDVILLHLETLILSESVFVSGNSLSGTLDRLTLPSLRTLQITETFLVLDDLPWNEPIDTLVSLVARSGCNLQELFVPDAKTRHEQNYRTTFSPSTSIMLIDELFITDPFLRQMDSQ
ncbi:F-box domain-containing protein [Mycena venus]|uniref:F-box domain-containing protein n=1 Tax=Mycena venus TaxID=2733690 RepID=A0A8H6U1B3_9AGAR|nr:F-box domain-containing protein [Mycena venus]